MSKAAIKHLAKSDKVLARIIQKVGAYGLVPELRRSPFEALVRSVTYQQLSGAAAGTIFGRVKALYPRKKFPSPQNILATTDQELRGAGLSRAKVAAIKDIAAKTLEGIVPSSRVIATLDDAAILERLTTIRGVGPWTVEMLLIFTLGRLDVLPATDYGVRKGFALVYGLKELPKPADLHAAGEKWRPYRSVAAWYLWRSLD